MMAVLLLKNVISINRKLKNQNERSADADLFAVPELHRTQPSQPAAPVTPVAPAAPAQRSTPSSPLSRRLPRRPASAPAAALIWMRMATAPTAIRSKLLLGVK